MTPKTHDIMGSSPMDRSSGVSVSYIAPLADTSAPLLFSLFL